MSQIDKMVYMPLIFWFMMLMLMLYFMIFSFFLTVFLSIFQVRVLYFKKLNNVCVMNYKIILTLLLFNKMLFSSYFTYLNSLNKFI